VRGTAGAIDQARNILWATEASRVTAHANRSGSRESALMLMPARSEWTGKAQCDEHGR
jgi:hypothetical protein